MDGSINVVDLRANASETHANLVGQLSGVITALQIIDETYLAAGSSEGVVALFDLRNSGSAPLFNQPLHSQAVSSITAVDEVIIGSSGLDGRVQFFDKHQGSIREMQQKPHNGAAVTGLLSLGRGKFLTSSSDTTVKLWHHDSENDFKLWHTLYGHTLPVWGIKQRKHLLASWGKENSWKIWKFTQNQKPTPLAEMLP